MPTYVYVCYACTFEFEVVCPISAIDEEVACERCDAANGKSSRQLTRTHFYGAKVEDAYRCPALGKVITSKKQRDEEAKRRGLIEIGNEKPETVHAYFDGKREEMRKERWAEADREKVYE